MGTSLMSKVLIVAGGTGGHMAPALNVAQTMRKQGVDVHWIASGSALERVFMRGKDMPLDTIQVSGLRDRSALRWLPVPFMLMRACWQAWRLIGRIKPKGVLAMGGYVSGPVGIMAWVRGLPLLIHEQNTVLGLSNRLLLPFATRVLTAFSGVCSSSKSLTLGNPIDATLLSLPPPQQRYATKRGALRILILGGSQGAREINQHLPVALADISKTDMEIWHQSGEQDKPQVLALYEQHALKARVSAFIDDMPHAYAWADLVVCRAGALTLAELAGVGVAAVIVPLTGVAGDHQVRNASRMSATGGARHMSIQEIQTGGLDALLEIEHPRKLLQQMACALYQLREEHATERVVSECRKVFHV